MQREAEIGTERQKQAERGRERHKEAESGRERQREGGSGGDLRAHPKLNLHAAGREVCFCAQGAPTPRSQASFR